LRVATSEIAHYEDFIELQNLRAIGSAHIKSEISKSTTFSEPLNLSMLILENRLYCTWNDKSSSLSKPLNLHLLRLINSSNHDFIQFGIADFIQFGIAESIAPLLLKLAMPNPV